MYMTSEKFERYMRGAIDTVRSAGKERRNEEDTDLRSPIQLKNRPENQG
jgi:hypothetical protein